MEPHTPTPSFPRPAGTQSPVAGTDYAATENPVPIVILGVPVATGMAVPAKAGTHP